jgi:LysR family hydrogen peroxide-inducible transcriptional activator
MYCQAEFIEARLVLSINRSSLPSINYFGGPIRLTSLIDQISKMNIQQFQYVLAVAELKHFEQAAEKCCITQSTLSTMIRKFENEIGLEIFDRKSKPVAITKEGKAIINQLKILIKEVETLQNTVQELKGEMAGDLQIGVIPTVAPYLLPLFLSEFAGQFPKLKITVQEMTTTEIQKSLKSRSLDIGIAALPLNDSELREIPLYEEPFLIFDCFSQDSDNLNRTIEDISLSHLLLLEEGHSFRTQVEQICNLSKLKVSEQRNFEFKAGSIDSLVRFAKSYKGITLLPQMASLGLSKEDQEFVKAFAPPVPIRSVGIMVHKHFVKKRIIEALQRIISEAVSTKLKRNVSGELVKPV